MLQEGMNSLDSWGTETGRDHYCNGAEDCGGGRGGERQAPVLGAGGMKAVWQRLGCIFQLWGLALIGNH